MDKRGFTYLFIGLIVSVIILIVLVIFTVFIWKPFVLDVGNDYLCLINIIIRSQSGNFYLDKAPIIGPLIPRFETSIPLICKTHDRVVKNKEEAKKTIAKEMAACWGRLGEGRFDLVGTIQFPWDTKNLCYVCSRIRTKGDNLAITAEEIAYYLNTKQPRPLYDQRTYFQYLSGAGYEKFKVEERVKVRGNIEIREDNSLFVFFFVNRAEDYARKAERFATGFVIGAIMTPAGILDPVSLFVRVGGGLIVGTASALGQKKGFNSNIMIGDSEIVKKVCTEFIE